MKVLSVKKINQQSQVDTSGPPLSTWHQKNRVIWLHLYGERYATLTICSDWVKSYLIECNFCTMPWYHCQLIILFTVHQLIKISIRIKHANYWIVQVCSQYHLNCREMSTGIKFILYLQFIFLLTRSFRFYSYFDKESTSPLFTLSLLYTVCLDILGCVFLVIAFITKYF